MRQLFLLSIIGVLVLAFCGCHDSTRPSRTLEGTWDLVSFSDHGVEGATTGTCTFLPDGTFSIVGTVTYPGETTDSLRVSGTYRVVSNVLTLTIPEGTASWLITWPMVVDEEQVILTLIGSDPPTRITLRRHN